MAEHALNMTVIGVFVLATDGKHGDSRLCHQPSRHLILGAQWIGGAEGDVRPSGFQHLHEIAGLRRHVQTGGDAYPGERMLRLEPLAHQLQHRHALSSPGDAISALGR